MAFPISEEEDCPIIDGKVNYSVISEDQINIGKWLSKKDRIIITDNEEVKFIAIVILKF